ncbi:hypothetical protein HPP92_009259 [Vanilla planifolia]|uniref:Uncharacterized protein n=1 Tax=Vanilla planifolia TaxID=51239 RepID=A0A835R463_VANPL|nr:hypothetical protein HPP92_009259 [Vanilla planifolia]
MLAVVSSRNFCTLAERRRRISPQPAGPHLSLRSLNSHGTGLFDRPHNPKTKKNKAAMEIQPRGGLLTVGSRGPLFLKGLVQ